MPGKWHTANCHWGIHTDMLLSRLSSPGLRNSATYNRGTHHQLKVLSILVSWEQPGKWWVVVLFPKRVRLFVLSCTLKSVHKAGDTVGVYVMGGMLYNHNVSTTFVNVSSQTQIKTKSNVVLSVRASILECGHTFCCVCTFVQLVFVKEDGPKPGSSSLTGNCMIMFSNFPLHHWTPIA